MNRSAMHSYPSNGESSSLEDPGPARGGRQSDADMSDGKWERESSAARATDIFLPNADVRLAHFCGATPLGLQCYLVCHVERPIFNTKVCLWETNVQWSRGR